MRKRTWIKLVDDEEALVRHTKMPSFRRAVIFGENFVGIEKRPRVITLNKPIYIGMCILDLAKLEMYRFHYEKMMTMYGPERLRMLMTDTDSFVYQIETQDIYADMQKHLDWYDSSNYPPSHPLFSSANKKRLGKMKDELAGQVIRLFVGLRAKVYTIVTVEDERIMRAKGVKRSAVNKFLTHAEYLAVLYGAEPVIVEQRQISGTRHDLRTVRQERIALSAVDDKRWVLNDNIHTYAHGHYAIAQNDEDDDDAL